MADQFSAKRCDLRRKVRSIHQLTSFLFPLILLTTVVGCGFVGEGDGSETLGLAWPTKDADQLPVSADDSASNPSMQEPTATIVAPSVPDTGWQVVRRGLERRVINTVDETGGGLSLYLLRIDPDYYSFDVGYRPGDPQSLLKWSEETGAMVVVNGGFFTEDDVATGLIVTDGVPSGSSYQGFGGMFSVDEEGAHLRSLQQQPYSESEVLKAALQSFPMLITPGGNIAYKYEKGEKARRTVVAMDRDRRMMIIISPSAAFTLAEMGAYLASSDLNLDSALNLDGGASTGLVLSDPTEGIPAFSELPSVILVYEK
jgi:hypothetical protein